MDYRNVKAGDVLYYYKGKNVFEFFMKVKCVSPWPRERFEILEDHSYRIYPEYEIGKIYLLSFSYLFLRLKTVVKNILAKERQQDVIVAIIKKRG